MTSKRLTRARAIKEYCKNSCCAGSVVDWRECPSNSCILWRFRLGREVLGNQTSYKKKHRQKASFSAKNNDSGEGSQKAKEITSKDFQLPLTCSNNQEEGK